MIRNDGSIIWKVVHCKPSQNRLPRKLQETHHQLFLWTFGMVDIIQSVICARKHLQQQLDNMASLCQLCVPCEERMVLSNLSPCFGHSSISVFFYSFGQTYQKKQGTVVPFSNISRSRSITCSGSSQAYAESSRSRLGGACQGGIVVIKIGCPLGPKNHCE